MIHALILIFFFFAVIAKIITQIIGAGENRRAVGCSCDEKGCGYNSGGISGPVGGWGIFIIPPNIKRELG